MIFFKYLFIFCLFSVVGWILELTYRSITNKKFVNPGFMSGCVVPIYGFGSVIMYLLCNLFSSINSNYKIIIIFILSVILLTALEFLSGFILLKYFNLRLWDYSKCKYNYKGFICIEFSMIWGLLALLFYLFIYPYIGNIATNFINNPTNLFLLGIFMGIFFVDLGVSIGLLNKLNKYAKIISATVDVERLRLDIRRKLRKGKFINAIYPYISTNKFLSESIKEVKNEDIKK